VCAPLPSRCLTEWPFQPFRARSGGFFRSALSSLLRSEHFPLPHARSHTQHSRKYSLFCEHLDNDDVFILVCLAACICTTPTKIFFFFIFEEEFIFFFDDDDASTLVKTWRNHEFKSFVFPKRCHHEQRGANPNETHGRTESGVHFQLQNLRWWR